MVDLVVVGAGVIGLATAWAARRKGLSVTVLDKASIPNPEGSSYDRHRLIRLPYGSQSGYRRMIPAAYDAWEQVWSDLGASHYVPTGTLLAGPPASGWSGDSFRDLRSAGVPLDDLAADDVDALVPCFRPRAGHRAVLLASGGVLLADRIVSGLAAWLRDHGAQLVAGARVVACNPDGVVDDRGRVHRGRQVVVATGAWPAPSGATSFTASRQVVGYIDVPDPARWSRAPMVLDLSEPGGFYLVPPVAGTPVKVGDHAFSLAGSADDQREVLPGERAAVRGLVASRLPGLENSLSAFRACYYAVVDDERFRVDRDGGVWRLYGFSGHGFKFGAEVGRRMAEVVAGERSAGDFATWLAGRP